MRVIVLLCVIWSCWVSANVPDFILPFVDQNTPPLTQSDLTQRNDMVECGDEHRSPIYCSDVVEYYKTSAWAELEIIDNKVTSVRMHIDFSRIAHSDLQLNLRRDGFQLTQVMIGDQRFSVQEQLAKHSMPEVDKALVLFLNKTPATFPQQQQWQKGNNIAQLVTDGQAIRLVFTHSESTL
ncbi:hypothetical protein MEG05_18235 [Vibrio aestuarianus]|uniref:hypothetical protein n=1 Tax=Vibrio aestuarianus TaxID=28171 RepID=UPI00237D25CC|nr:hypothetical protein [Vibrio aestuarianus]MDE1315943.1 hypothetical protein [Vibrio aestuarianus]